MTVQLFPADEPPQPDRVWFLRGLRHSAGIFAIVLAATFLGIGSLCREAELPLLWSVLGTVLIWAGPAHVILVAGLMAGAPKLSIALAVTLSSVRLMPMVVSLMAYLRSPPRPMAVNMLAGHLIAISGWVEGMRVLPGMKAEGRMPFFLGLALGLISSAAIATVVGYQLAGAISHEFQAGLLFLTPVFFLISLLSNLARRIDRLAVVSGFGGLVIAAPLAGTLDLLWAGIGGGTAAYFINKVLR